MTIKNLFDTLEFSCYDKIVVHWPCEDGGDDYNMVSFDFAEPCVELFGNINIMTITETSEHDGGDASLFIHADEHRNVEIHIYLKREDIVRS
jgi:hypothetical protein